MHGKIIGARSPHEDVASSIVIVLQMSAGELLSKQNITKLITIERIFSSGFSRDFRTEILCNNISSKHVRSLEKQLPNLEARRNYAMLLPNISLSTSHEARNSHPRS
jgi:hypothetical protein